MSVQHSCGGMVTDYGLQRARGPRLLGGFGTAGHFRGSPSKPGYTYVSFVNPLTPSVVQCNVRLISICSTNFVAFYIVFWISHELLDFLWPYVFATTTTTNI